MVEVTLVVVSVEMAGIALEPSQVEMETVTTAVLVMVVPKALQDNLVVGVVAVRVVLVLQAVALDKVVPVAAGVVAVAVAMTLEADVSLETVVMLDMPCV